MTLAPGSRLGPYEVVAPLGAGGMGEVYRARDPRLGREVAIKVLPPHLIDNAEARARFEREARSVSSLNHPNICVLHDVGREGDTDYLVMELVEGETLAARITRGPLPIADLLRIGGQIADALDKAHRAGVVHRDLKPSNVMLTKSGAKLMDFGLARGASTAATAGALTQAPTAADPVTAQGTILGTIPYMAPEQLEGRDADARSDLWALGCVLYEMATGTRPFAGGTPASLIGAILRDTPRPMAERAPLSPPAFERAVTQCLAKDPDDRWQSAGDLRRELEWIASGSGAASIVTAAPRRGNRGVLAGAAAVVLGVAILAWLAVGRPVPMPAIEAALVPPAGIEVASPVSRPLPIAISRDGDRIVFVGHESEGIDRLWMRSLADGRITAIPGTERAQGPFFSPDGQAVGFFADGKLRRVDVTGGPVAVLADATDPRGGSWGPDGSILFVPISTGPVLRVRADGGPVTAITTLDSTNGETTHRYPHWLPDGRHFLYLARRSGAGSGRQPMIHVADARTGERRALLEVASNVMYASGHLLYAQQGTLVAQPFDLRRRAVHGRPRPVIADLTTDERFSRASFAVSQNGVLLALTGNAETRSQLRLRGRDGAFGARIGEPADYAFGGVPNVSPDGRTAAMPIVDRERGNADVWIVDLATGGRRRLTADTDDHFACLFSHDGREVLMTGGVLPSPRYFAYKPVAGLGALRRLAAVRPESRLWPLSFTADGSTFLYMQSDGRNDRLMTLALSPGATPVPLIPNATGSQSNGAFSADGRFVVYDSDETGRSEIYMAPFPGTGERWRVSQQGGWTPRWGRSRNEVLYVDRQNRLTSVAVTFPGGAPEFASPHSLFALSASISTEGTVYDERPDGSFLVVEIPEGSRTLPIRMLTHWTAKLDPK